MTIRASNSLFRFEAMIEPENVLNDRRLQVMTGLTNIIHSEPVFRPRRRCYWISLQLIVVGIVTCRTMHLPVVGIQW